MISLYQKDDIVRFTGENAALEEITKFSSEDFKNFSKEGDQEDASMEFKRMKAIEALKVGGEYAVVIDQDRTEGDSISTGIVFIRSEGTAISIPSSCTEFVK